MERKMATTGAQKVGGLAAAAVCVIAGFFVLIHYSTAPVIEYGRTLSWVKENGTVIKAGMERRACVVSYTYAVGATSYNGTRTRTEGVDSARSARALCKKFEVLPAKSAVWYDPASPSRSALRVTYIGDFWLAVNLLDSLALVALGGALALWSTARFEPLLVCCLFHSALCFLSAVPISILRASRGVAAAALPITAGVACGIVAFVCAFQLRCGSRNAGSQALRSKSLDGLWFTNGDVGP